MVDTSVNSSCKTVSGSLIGKSCHFPFKYKDREYNDCTWEWAFDGFDDDAWTTAAMDVDRNGCAWCGTREVEYGKDWGDCGDGCPIPGKKHSSITKLHLRTIRIHSKRHLIRDMV